MTKEEYLRTQKRIALEKYMLPDTSYFYAVDSYCLSKTGFPCSSKAIVDMEKYYHHIKPGWGVRVFGKKQANTNGRPEAIVVDSYYDTEGGLFFKLDIRGEIRGIRAEYFWIGVTGTKEEYLRLQYNKVIKFYAGEDDDGENLYEAIGWGETEYVEYSIGIVGMRPYYHLIKKGWFVSVFSADLWCGDFTVKDIIYETDNGIIIVTSNRRFALRDHYFGVEGP